MRFRIEYLKESTEEHSVCHVQDLTAETVTQAEETAWNSALLAWSVWRATGFQIRDMEREGEIVMVEPFNLPIHE